MKSKWKPSIVISTNSDAEELMSEDGREKILDSYVGKTKEGEPWIIPMGEIDVKTIQPLTLNDLCVSDSIAIDKKAICAAVGHVPPYLIGAGDYNKDEFNNFVQTTIASISQIIAQQFTNKLLLDSNLYFKFNNKSLIQYSLTEHVQFVKEMVAGGMLNRNEGRNEFDYSPVDDNGMNDYIVLENYIPVSDVGKQKKLKGGEEDV